MHFILTHKASFPILPPQKRTSYTNTKFRVTRQDRIGLDIDADLQMVLVYGFRLVLPNVPNGYDEGDIPAIGDTVINDILHLLDKHLAAIQLKDNGLLMPEINIVLGIRNHCQGK